MKTLLLATTLLSIPSLALSRPKLELRQEIERTYNPQIQARVLNQNFSLYGCRLQNIEITGQDPITLKDRKIKVMLYQGRDRKNTQRAVILLPPTGGVNILDKGYANEICTSGITVALIAGWDHQNDVSLDIEMHNRGAFRALAATRHVVEYLDQNNFNSIGILGTSIGAITSSLVLGYEPRVSTAALIVGSARFADVIAETSEQGAAKLRNERMKHYGYQNLEDYRAAIRNVIRVEPNDFIDEARHKNSLLITGDADITVPTSYQMELVSDLKPQKHISLRGNHFQAIKSSFFWHRTEIVNFFKQNL